MKATGIIRRVDELGRIVLPIDTKSLFLNIFNDNESGHTATVSTPIKQGQDEPQETVEDAKEQVDVKQVNSLVSLLIKLVEKLLGIFK